MDKSAIDTPSREIDLGNIPVHLRTALRRALEFEARAPAPRSAEEAEQCEEQLRVIADEFFGALLTPVLQRAVRSAAVGDAASALVRHLPRRMRSDGLETVNVRTSRGTTVPVTTPYYREKHARRAKRRPGLYPALVVLGIYDRCTPKLASDASRAVAMHSSLAEAQAQLRSDGIALDIKTLRSTAYRYAARARAAQQSAACGLLDRVTGKRVVVSLDGGRVRVRRKKRGPKTKKGRNRFHTDWKEPKLLILYVVGDDGRPSQTWAPIIDGTLRGPEAVFALLLSYARQIGLNAADKVLFIADGAPWIWRRLQRLIAALGLSPTQVLGLIDFYHAAKQLSDAVKLRRWSATQRTRWLNRTRGLLKRARVDEVITALRELCRGRTARKIRTHLNYFLKNGRIPDSRSSAVCRQRWTVRLGEVEPVFGQTGRVVLDITARTAHDGALKWTRPSTPRAARSILATFPSTYALPSGGRWSLRRVLQRPGRQRKRSSAKSSCGPSRTSSSAPSSPPCCNARWAPPRLATRRAPSCATCPGGCGATAWRPSTFAPPGARRCRSRRRTTARNTPVGRSGGRDSTPPWWCWASTTGARRSWPRMQAARSPCTARWPKRRRSSAPTASPWISRPSARPPIATLRGPERPSRARRAACWTA